VIINVMASIPDIRFESPPTGAQAPASAEPSPADRRISHEALAVILDLQSNRGVIDPVIAGSEVHAIKEHNADEIQKGFRGWWRKYDPCLVGGDIFTVAYLGFQIAASAGATGLGITLCVMGSIAGGLTVYAGVKDTYEGLIKLKTAIQNKNWSQALTAWRMIAVGITEILLGLFLIAAPILMTCFATLSISAFLLANPWLLALLCLLPTLGMFIDLGKLVYQLATHQTLAQQLDTKALSTKEGRETWIRRIRALALTCDDPISKDNQSAIQEQIAGREDPRRTKATQLTRQLIDAKLKTASISVREATLIQQYLEKAELAAATVEETAAMANLFAQSSKTEVALFQQHLKILQTAPKTVDQAIADELKREIGLHASAERQKAGQNIEQQIDEKVSAKEITAEEARQIKAYLLNSDVRDPPTKAMQRLFEQSTPEEVAAIEQNYMILTMDDASFERFIDHRNIMDNLDATLGIDAAQSVFSLYLVLETCPESAPQPILIEAVQKQLDHWVVMKWLQIAVQIFYIIAFGVGMATIPQLNLPKETANIINIVTNAFLAIANAIPIYLDGFEWTLRNTSVTIPPVTMQKIAELQLMIRDEMRKQKILAAPPIIVAEAPLRSA
jgi:hypothetical protein